LSVAEFRRARCNRRPEADARAAASRLAPEPLAAPTTGLRIGPERFGRVPRACIEADDDRAISLEMQREMQAALPCAPVITLESDHSPFRSATRALADALLKLA
jgi:hypothetical protein